MNSEHWYYAVGQNSIGPFTYEQLRELHVVGVITDDSLICKSGGEEWIRYSDMIVDKNCCHTETLPATQASDPVGPQQHFTTIHDLNSMVELVVMGIVSLAVILIVYGQCTEFYRGLQYQRLVAKIANEGTWGPYPIIGEDIADTSRRLGTSSDELTLDRNGLHTFSTIRSDFKSRISTYFSEDKVVGFLYITIEQHIPESDRKHVLSETRARFIQRDIESVYRKSKQITFKDGTFVESGGNEIIFVRTDDGCLYVFNEASLQLDINTLRLVPVDPQESE